MQTEPSLVESTKLTVLNAVIGLRQKGKAERAMNALRSMMKTTARIRRDGTESEIPSEQVVNARRTARLPSSTQAGAP